MASLLKLLLPFAPGIVGWVLKRFFGIDPATDANEKERRAGENYGRADAAAEANRRELDDAQKAVDASRRAGDFDDAGGVRDSRPGDRPWSPDGLG